MTNQEIEILYKDEDVIAVNKPPGIVVFSENKDEITIAKLLSDNFSEIKGLGGERNGAVHRLDKDTSGVLLFARNNHALSFLQREILEQKAKKRYITLVFKRVKEDSGEIRTFITRSPKDRRKQKAYKGGSGKRESVTFFHTLKRFADFSLLEIWPKTGRKHQIRCHLAYIGHPVAGESLYRFKDQQDPAGLERQFLHASLMEIQTPKGKKRFSAELPEKFESIIKNLKNNYVG